MKTQTKPVVHLICNAHLDPVWQWEWEEGVSEAISTFRTAADLCEEFNGFVFNHNEVILYQWIDEYEPELFKRIQRLVKAGKWHIMGGWYLQPDCNIPSGEGLVRQILAGREYFKKNFGSRPTTAINFDPFGHSRGLVQILAKSGYDSYIHCRPTKEECGMEDDNYVWVGYDGSEILCTRQPDYNSSLGKAGEKLTAHLETNPTNVSMILWGVGNHGGGPSRKDIRDINKIISQEKSYEILHSTPEKYFKDLKQHKDKLVHWSHDLNPWAVGCYSSMALIKQGYRALENELFMTEKMVSTASAQNLMSYPDDKLKDAEKDLLWIAFHDVLPGSSTAPVEKHSLQKIGHGLEILSKIRAQAFFCLAGGESKAKPETFPVFVYNPHPWKVQKIVIAEFNLPDVILCPNTFWVPSLTHKGKAIPIQAERPDSNMPMDWRKRVCFQAQLEPGKMNRFEVKLTRKPKRPELTENIKNGVLRVTGKSIDWAINIRSGLVEYLRFNGKDILRKGAFKALVIADSSDPWGMEVDRFDQVIGRFKLLSQMKSGEISGFPCKKMKPVRVIEDGPVRTVVEAVYGYNDSFLVLTWKIPRNSSKMEVAARVFWNEKDKMLKLSLPTSMQNPVYMGEVVYGREELPNSGREVVAQKWNAMVSKDDDLALTIVNDGTYASSCLKGEMRVTLLRSPGYTAHPWKGWQVMPDNMFRPRMDQGERIFNFQINGGPVKERMDEIAPEAQVYNENPMTQWFSPSGTGVLAKPFATLSNQRVQITTIKQAENGKGWIIRLFEPTGRKQKTQLSIEVGQAIKINLTLHPFEIKSLLVNIKLGIITETNLIEE